MDQTNNNGNSHWSKIFEESLLFKIGVVIFLISALFYIPISLFAFCKFKCRMEKIGISFIFNFVAFYLCQCYFGIVLFFEIRDIDQLIITELITEVFSLVLFLELSYFLLEI